MSLSVFHVVIMARNMRLHPNAVHTKRAVDARLRKRYITLVKVWYGGAKVYGQLSGPMLLSIGNLFRVGFLGAIEQLLGSIKCGEPNACAAQLKCVTHYNSGGNGREGWGSKT